MTTASNLAMLQKQPVQRRSQERLAKILDAADKILREQGPSGLGFHAIAQQANIPPSSVYQYFSGKDVLLLALAQRFFASIQPFYIEEFNKAKISQWQDIIGVVMNIARRVYTQSPHSAPLILGSYRTSEIYFSDKIINEQMAKQLRASFEQRFILPKLEHLERIFLLAVEISDAVWATSLRLHGEITDSYYEEAKRATISYLANYLPPILPAYKITKPTSI